MKAKHTKEKIDCMRNWIVEKKKKAPQKFKTKDFGDVVPEKEKE